MAIIRCPECRAKISDKATACVKCGAPVAAGKKKKKNRGCDFFGLVILIVVIMVTVQNREKILPLLSGEVSRDEVEETAEGTLQSANMAEWTESKYENRLATASALLNDALTAEGKPMPSPEEFKSMAEEFEAAISAANQNRLLDDQQVSTVAETCWLIMND